MTANWTGAPAYREAGYEEIHVNSSYIGGVAKQHDLLSFSRVFQAGHDVAWYQPETSFQIFNRAIFGHDIPTGRKNLSRNRHAAKWSTNGPLSAWGWKEQLPASPPVECYMYDIATMCTKNQVSTLISDTVVTLSKSAYRDVSLAFMKLWPQLAAYVLPRTLFVLNDLKSAVSRAFAGMLSKSDAYAR